MNEAVLNPCRARRVTRKPVPTAMVMATAKPIAERDPAWDVLGGGHGAGDVDALDHQGPEHRGDEGDRPTGRDVELAHDEDARDAARGDPEDGHLFAEIEEVRRREEDAFGQYLEDDHGRQDRDEQPIQLDVLEHRLRTGFLLEELEHPALGVGGGGDRRGRAVQLAAAISRGLMPAPPNIRLTISSWFVSEVGRMPATSPDRKTWIRSVTSKMSLNR